MAKARLTAFAAAAALALAAAAQDADERPSLEFLEYLGSWDAGDEDWVVVAEQFMGQPASAQDEAAAADEAEPAAADEEDETDEDDAE